MARKATFNDDGTVSVKDSTGAVLMYRSAEEFARCTDLVGVVMSEYQKSGLVSEWGKFIRAAVAADASRLY